MLLSDREILIAMQNGDLVIEPTPPDDSEQFQAASVDLRLDPTIWIPQDTTSGSNLPVPDEFDFEDYLAERTIETDIEAIGGFRLMPGNFIIGRTLETVGLSNLLSGRVEGRSRLARLGIGVHVTAPKIDPGFNNKITLEIFHVGKVGVFIPHNAVICTLLVERLGHPAGRGYRGMFQG